ncbi:MAG: YicC family protein [Treponema sp.]|nr:YicC family protein [Treponema sp.]
MRSMTAYSYGETQAQGLTLSVEFRGYNNRFLDLTVHLPFWLSSLEMRIREYLGSRFVRGKIDVGIRIKDNVPEIEVNEETAWAYYRAMEDLAKKMGINEKPSLELLLNREGVLKTETPRDAEPYWVLIEPLLIQGADQFDEERKREGRHTLEDILGNLSVIDGALEKIRGHVPEMENTIKENLRERFNELLGDRIDEGRILSETAVILVKNSISEELSRLSSHLGDFRKELDANDSPGKKLDFLSQEINREINTIGSKTPQVEVSRAVIEMKNALENIREQLRNVE